MWANGCCNLCQYRCFDHGFFPALHKCDYLVTLRLRHLKGPQSGRELSPRCRSIGFTDSHLVMGGLQISFSVVERADRSQTP